MMVAERPACKVFNGRYTLESTLTGAHRTFRIWTQPQDAEFAGGKRIVGLLTGPENSNPDDYTGFAFIDDFGIHVWKSKQGDDKLFNTYGRQLWSLVLDAGFSPWAASYHLLIEGRCLRCNRALTTPDSIRLGIGPICAGKGF